MTEHYIKAGDYFENCGFQPALCIHTELDEDGNLDMVHGVSLVTGSGIIPILRNLQKMFWRATYV